MAGYVADLRKQCEDAEKASEPTAELTADQIEKFKRQTELYNGAKAVEFDLGALLAVDPLKAINLDWLAKEAYALDPHMFDEE